MPLKITSLYSPFRGLEAPGVPIGIYEITAGTEAEFRAAVQQQLVNRDGEVFFNIHNAWYQCLEELTDEGVYTIRAKIQKESPLKVR